MQSLTLRGLLVMILSFVLSETGMPGVEGKVEIFIEVLFALAGIGMVYFGRLRLGGLNIFGKRKSFNTQPPAEPSTS